IMEWAARSGDAALAAAVVAIPAARLSVDGQRRFVALVADLLRHPEPSVRLQVLGRCGREPLPDPERRLLPRLLQALDSSIQAEAVAAAAAVFSTYAEDDPGALAGTVGRLLANRRAL